MFAIRVLTFSQSEGESNGRLATIRRVEVVDGEIPVTAANEAAIRRALESAGIEFIDENGTGEGVRFRKPRRVARK